MTYLLLAFNLLFNQSTWAQTNPCDQSLIQIGKTNLTDSDIVFNIVSENLACFESQNTVLHPIYKEFKNFVSDRTNTEPLYLINLQRSLFVKHLPEFIPIFDFIIEGKIGTIREINALEAFLMTEQIRLNGSSGEFGAYILKAPSGNLKVYFSSHHEAAVPPNKDILRTIEKDLKAGYILMGHLHNHPFFFDNLSGDIAGTVVPSGPDRSYYKNLKNKYGLKHAYVTNGFSTIEIPESQFELLPED